jgi:hypothetical protein
VHPGAAERKYWRREFVQLTQLAERRQLADARAGEA